MSGRGAEVAVVGAGPAGVAAALAAAGQGLDTVLLEEAEAAGGQVYRALPAGFARQGHGSWPEVRLGDALRSDLAASRVRFLSGRRVWLVTGGFRLDALGPDGPETLEASALIAATGAYERVIPFPGWTLPGVIGLAAATILLKSQKLLPARRTLVAGCGPLLAAVAAGILEAGGEVAAVIDLNARTDWLGTLPAMAARPDLLGRGLGWLARLARARVPVLHRRAVTAVEAGPDGLRATISRVDATWRPQADSATRLIEAECLAVGHGLVPATELTRLLRAGHRFAAAAGGWVPAHDADGRTEVERLYVAGDGAGLEGAAAAPLSGRLAGLAAARDLGVLHPDAHESLARPLRRQRARASRFGRAMAALTRPHPGLTQAIPPETLVCRCEDVTRAEIEAAILAGAREVNQLKAWTRCGMGPCQGRMCGEAAAGLVARAAGGRERAGVWTGRAPLRPAPVADLVGAYDYGDIPIPPAAPL